MISEIGAGLILRLGALLLGAALVPWTCTAFGAVASADGTSGLPREEQRTAPATADAFSDAIAAGNSAAARALLMPGVLIFESGDVERSADEYSRHHLPSDIDFLAGMQIQRLSRTSGGDRTTCWVATKSRMRGHYKGKSVDLNSTETLILTLTSAGWRIAHIHWSSSQHRGGGTTH